MMLRPGSSDKLTVLPAVEGREMDGKVKPARWLQPPSSEGAGISDQFGVAILVLFWWRMSGVELP